MSNQRLPDPRPNDSPQINLILDHGIKGVKPHVIRPDTNRQDPLSGFINALSRGILLPHGLLDAAIQLMTLAAAGGFCLATLTTTQAPPLRLGVGLVVLCLSGATTTACIALPQLRPHAYVKAIAFGGGGLLVTWL